MIGADYERVTSSDWNKPIGKARASYAPVTSSNADFASSLAALDLSQAGIRRGEREHHDVRREWLERFQPSSEDFDAIRKLAFLNGFVEIMHHDPFSNIQFSLGNHFPPPEPKPPLKEDKLFAPLRWFLGEDLYRKKISAINRSAMYRDADKKTKIHPLTHENLRTIAAHASSPTGAAQNYEYVAIRLLDGIVDSQRTILASPLYGSHARMKSPVRAFRYRRGSRKRSKLSLGSGARYPSPTTTT